MKDNQAKYPQLRFKGFTDSWEQRKVSELADRYDNLRVPITASERVAGETPYYGANGIQDYVEGFTHNGEFVLVAEDGANDLQNYPVQYVDGKVWVNNHAHVLQAKEERVDNKFLTNALKHTNIEPYLVGGGRAKLNADVMMKINFKVPTLPEQVQIGKFFDNLDHLITLHQRKLAKLKELKQGYLQKLFPENGSKFPQLRFAGFADAWEERKLGDYVIIRSGWSPSNFDINNNANNLFIKVDDLNYSTRVQEESQVKVNILSKYKKIKKSSTIFPKRGAAIMTNKVRMLGEDSYMDTNMMALEPKGIDPEYLYTFINKTGLYKIADTSTIPQINNKHIEPYLLLIPSLEEQHKIGSFFKQLDDTITLHQRKLEKLQELKKGYLQKMFC
ncbi:restriction endonuclease subunit S [Lentilactobacillus hilgardii]|uniref:restriction endonuclease subunit S n=1 Tax=Lentilactobacillus hilgardii TaxID=1588 RepID=UPI00390C6690